MKTTLVLVRHGESLWNRKNIFTGWTDIDLSPTGIKEAAAAGQILADQHFQFDLAYTSVLSRAIKTLWLILEKSGQMYLPVINSWQLNERHYGGLQGLNKAQVKKQVGEAQFLLWRRSYDTPPPALDKAAQKKIASDPRYKQLPAKLIPTTESLKDTCARVWPFWLSDIEPQIRQGKKIIISAHGNSLRGLIKHLENISDADIVKLEIPTGNPLVYELELKGKKITVLSKRYLKK